MKPLSTDYGFLGVLGLNGFGFSTILGRVTDLQFLSQEVKAKIQTGPRLCKESFSQK